MIKTVLTTEKGTITHQGTSGFTVTITREGYDCYTEIEYSDMSEDETREMMCTLLCMLEEKCGEPFVTSCFARYAQETGKEVFDQENGRRIVIIRGED